VIPALRAIPPARLTQTRDTDAPSTLFLSDAPEAAGLAAQSAQISHAMVGGLLRVEGSRDALSRFAAELRLRGHPTAERVAQFLAPASVWQLRTVSLSLDKPIIMGILNLTADSFSGDGVGDDATRAVRRAESLRADGATLIDVGAETARADRPVIEAEREARTISAAVRALVGEGHIVSVDTYKGSVAAAALAEGANAVNDISGLTLGLDAAVAAAQAGAGYVLNYSFSPPKRRPDTPPRYNDVVAETLAWFEARLPWLHELGLARDRIAIDPGIAFGKSHDEDIQVLSRLDEILTPGLPLLLAHSRKNFIGSVNGAPVAERDLETHAVSAIAFARGARIFRVHDVAGTRRALDLAAAITSAQPGTYAPDDRSWPWRAGAATAHATDAQPAWSAPPGQRW